MCLAELALEATVNFGTSGVRGQISDMSDAICFAFTQSFIRAIAPEATSIVLGHDLRPSSPHIAAACIQAIKAEGKSVISRVS